MSVYRIHYIDTVNKHNAYSQVAVEAIIYFDNDSAGIKKLEAQKVALESFLRSSFYNVKEQKSVNHPEIVFLLAGPKKNGWVFVTKQMDKKRNAYYLKVMYRITSYQYRKF